MSSINKGLLVLALVCLALPLRAAGEEAGQEDHPSGWNLPFPQSVVRPNPPPPEGSQPGPMGPSAPFPSDEEIRQMMSTQPQQMPSPSPAMTPGATGTDPRNVRHQRRQADAAAMKEKMKQQRLDMIQQGPGADVPTITTTTPGPASPAPETAAPGPMQVSISEDGVNILAEDRTVGEVLGELGRQGNFTAHLVPDLSSRRISISLFNTPMDRVVQRIFSLVQAKNYKIKFREGGAIERIDSIGAKTGRTPTGVKEGSVAGADRTSATASKTVRVPQRTPYSPGAATSGPAMMPGTMPAGPRGDAGQPLGQPAGDTLGRDAEDPPR